MFEKLLGLSKIIELQGEILLAEKLNEWHPNPNHVGLAICFSESGQYRGVRPFEKDKGVFYIQASGSNGFSICALQYLTSPSSSLEKIGRSISYLSEHISEKSSLKDNLPVMERNFDIDTIKGEIVQLKESFQRDDRPYIFIAILMGEKINPLYSDEFVQSAAIEELFNRYGQHRDARGHSLSSANKSCAICGNMREKVYGNFSLLKCYNLDKRGMISGGFRYPKASANFPVCTDCMASVTHGYSFVRENLSFWMCGQNYMLLPKVYDPKIREYVVDTIRSTANRQTLREDALKYITGSEKELLQELAATTGGKDTISLSFIFYEQKNAAWRITSEINEILPSRIAKIYDAKQEIENISMLRLSNRELNNGYYFTLATLRPFAGDNGKQSQKQFLDWVDAIFSGGKINEKTLLSKLVGTIVQSMKKEEENYRFTIRDAWAVYQFLEKLHVIEVKKGGYMVERENDCPFAKFLEDESSFFTNSEKIAAFLTGCYVNAVIYVQQQHLGNDPFFRKVRGLKLDKKRLQELYPEARNKLHQYNALGLVAKDLDPLLAKAWIDVGERWKITDDEATFSFTLGLALARNIKSKKRQRRRENDERPN